MLAPILAERPTQKALILMAELEEAETGDRGRAREWLARAVCAPRDPAWTADGVVLEEWAPVSPVTGKLDAVEWKVPLAEIEAPRLDLGVEALERPETQAEDEAEDVAGQSGALVVEDKKPVAVDEQAAPAAAVPALVPVAPQPIKLVAKAERLPDPDVVEPPRPDDPGVSADDDEDSRTELPAFLRSG